MRGYAAVVLAGGAARRLGGVDKPALPIGGRPMLHRVLTAVADATPRIVVGPPGPALPAPVRRTREVPPGGGPVAGAAAGLALIPAGTPQVALLAADLPFLTPEAVRALRRAAAAPGQEGAVFVDGTGHPQWLCGVWRVAALRARIGALPHGPAGVSLKALFGEVAVTLLELDPGGAPPPWYDCDTEADLRQAKQWTGPS